MTVRKSDLTDGFCIEVDWGDKTTGDKDIWVYENAEAFYDNVELQEGTQPTSH
jgi:hypothetical protein